MTQPEDPAEPDLEPEPEEPADPAKPDKAVQ